MSRVWVRDGQLCCYDCGDQFVPYPNRMATADGYLMLHCPNGHNRGTVAQTQYGVHHIVPVDLQGPICAGTNSASGCQPCHGWCTFGMGW